MDRTNGIQLLDDPITSIKELSEHKNGPDLPGHMEEHVYMFAGESVLATALLDRLTHRCQVMNLSDDSVRLANRQQIWSK